MRGSTEFQDATTRSPGASTAPETRVEPAFRGGTLGPIEKTQLYVEISRRIIERIQTGAWLPGQRLPPERELARLFGVSRPSLREALGALQALAVVETRHGAGSWIAEDAIEVVAAQSSFETFDLGVSPLALLEARAALEPTIASYAAARFSPDPEIERLIEEMERAHDWENPAHRAVWSDSDRLFHRRIAFHANNPVLLNAAEFIAAAMSDPLWRRLGDDTFAVPGRLEALALEHQTLLQAIQAGDATAAFDAAARHVEASRQNLGLQ